MARVVGKIETDKRIFGYQGDAKRSTAQETIVHKENDQTDGLTSAHVPKILQRGRGKNKGGLHETAPTVSSSDYANNNLLVSDSQRSPECLAGSSDTTTRTSETSGTLQTHPEHQPSRNTNQMCSRRAARLRLSLRWISLPGVGQLLENDRALMTPEALCFMRSHGFYHTKDPDIFYSKTLKACLVLTGDKLSREILRILTELDYRVETVVLNSKHYGVPQNRERVFFIGHLGERCSREILSFGNGDGEVVSSGSVEPISGTISTKNQSGQCQL
jgi:hypothetical protein